MRWFRIMGCGASAAALVALSACGSGQSSATLGTSVGAPVGTSGNSAISTAPGGDDSSSKFPEKNITMIVPVPGGSATDVLSRVVAQCLGKELKTNVIVMNRPGGSAAIGSTEFIKAANDGYTIDSASLATMVVPPLVDDSVAYGPGDFEPFAVTSEAAITLMVGKDSQYTTMSKLLDSAKATKVKIGIPGAATVPGIIAKSLVSATGADIETVPYAGSADTLQALRAKEVDAIMIGADLGVAMPAINDGTAVPIATAADGDVDYLPGVPSLASLGFKDIPYGLTTFLLAVPAGTPGPVVAVLENAAKACLVDPGVRDKIGNEMVPAKFIGADGAKEILERAAVGYAKVLNEK